MPQPPARLANCYVPLPIGASSLYKKNNNNSEATLKQEQQQQQTPSRRSDHRQTFELRQLTLETGVLSSSRNNSSLLGSSLVELGHSKVLCQVSLGTTDTVDVGTCDCRVKFAPHVGINAMTQRSTAVMALDANANNMVSAGKLHSETMTQEVNLSHQLETALLPVLPLASFPKSSIQIHVTILQDDGSILTACITAAIMALIDANVELFDMVTTCTVAVMANNDDDDNDDNSFVCLVDPTEAETLQADAMISLAMTPNHKEVTLWSQSGRLSPTQSNQALDLCRDGCRTMHKFMRNAWGAVPRHKPSQESSTANQKGEK